MSPTPSTLRQRYGLAETSNIDPTRTALIIVDLQRELLDGGLPVPDAKQVASQTRRLLDWARAQGVLVVFIQQVAASAAAPLFIPGSTGIEFAPGLSPQANELTIVKTGAGAFSRTNLHVLLGERGIEQLIVVGLMTHLAVDTTARDGTVLGYRVIVTTDATATRALPGPKGEGVIEHETVHRVALASLADRFAELFTTEEILALPLR